MTMRLDKFISNASLHTRAQIKRYAKQKRIFVNGVRTSNTALKVDETDHIEVCGEAIRKNLQQYYMLNKPKQTVSATKDANTTTVLDLLTDIQAKDLQVVGRLDIDTTGLTLITNDGQWNHAVTSPRSLCNKTYRVATIDPIEDSYIAAFEHGVLLRNETKPTQPATLTIEDSHTASLTISEGKYHQIKRMFAAMGNRVATLHRYQIGKITLDHNLEPGQYRSLTEEEVLSISSKDHSHD